MEVPIDCKMFKSVYGRSYCPRSQGRKKNAKNVIYRVIYMRTIEVAIITIV